MSNKPEKPSHFEQQSQDRIKKAALEKIRKMAEDGTLPTIGEVRKNGGLSTEELDAYYEWYGTKQSLGGLDFEGGTVVDDFVNLGKWIKKKFTGK